MSELLSVTSGLKVSYIQNNKKKISSHQSPCRSHIFKLKSIILVATDMDDIISDYPTISKLSHKNC